MIPQARAEPNIWATMYMTARNRLIWQLVSIPRVTAGLRWAPLMWPKLWASVAMASPKPSATFTSWSGLEMFTFPMAVAMLRKINRVIPTSSARTALQKSLLLNSLIVGGSAAVGQAVALSEETHVCLGVCVRVFEGVCVSVYVCVCVCGSHKQQPQAAYIRPGLIMVSGRALRRKKKTEREGHSELMRNPKDWSLLSLPLLPSAPSAPQPPAPLASPVRQPLSHCAALCGLWTLIGN